MDMHHVQFDDKLMISMVGQSGLNRTQFYCATKQTAGKIGGFYRKPKP